MASHGIGSKRKPFNDWPNDLGFETLQEQTEPVSLKVSGRIPAYAAGVLYRTGPGGYQIQTQKKKTTFESSHWFDGSAQTHRFVLAAPSNGEYITDVSYNSRHTCNGLIESIRKTGTIQGVTFGQKLDPCESIFRKVMSSFSAAMAAGPKSSDKVNVGVTIRPNMPTTSKASKDLDS